MWVHSIFSFLVITLYSGTPFTLAILVTIGVTISQYSCSKKYNGINVHPCLIGGEHERAPHLIVRRSSSVQFGVQKTHALFVPPLFVNYLCMLNDHSRRSRTQEERPRTRMSDPTLATDNELDHGRERARLRRVRDEQTNKRVGMSQ